MKMAEAAQYRYPDTFCSGVRWAEQQHGIGARKEADRG